MASIVSFNLYLVMMQAPFMMLGMLIMMGQRASASAGRIYEILDEQPTIVDRPGAVDLVDSQGDVEFDAGQLRLRADSMLSKPGDRGRRPAATSCTTSTSTCAPGETVALVGRTGSGKSTVARVLARFYDATGGTVRVDGHDVRDLTLTSLRANIGIVLDEPFLFSVSIRDNIAYGRPDASMEEVVAAAEAAGAAGFIQRLSDGYDTVVGRAGLHPLGRAAPAHRHRPRPAGQPAHPDPRRRHERHRRQGRAADPHGAARPDGGPHHSDHRPPPLDHQPGRPRRAARRRPRSWPTAPTPSCWPPPRSTPRCWPRPPAKSRRTRLPQTGPRTSAWTTTSSSRRGGDLMFGGGGGPPMGGGGSPGSAQAGLPFGGIPYELQAGVDLLLEEEPDRGESDVVFTQLPTEHEKKRLSLTGLLMEYPGMLVLAVLLVGIIALATQLGPEPRRHTPSTTA